MIKDLTIVLIISLLEFIGEYEKTEKFFLISEKVLEKLYTFIYNLLHDNKEDTNEDQSEDTNKDEKKKDLAWNLLSYFNSNHPEKSFLNFAMPSAVSYYFVYLLKPGNTYKVIGKFPSSDDSFQTNIQQYTINGNPLQGGVFLDSYFIGSKPINLEIIPNQENFLMLRIYLNTKKNSFVPNDWLCEIYKNDIRLPIATYQDQKIISDKYTPLAVKLIEENSDSSVTNNKFKKFFLPVNQGNNLFPDISHYYLVCEMGNYVNAIRIYGKNLKSNNKYIVYTDFIGVNSISTQTECAIAFFELSEDNYEFIICNHDYQVDDKFKHLKILRFSENIEKNQREIVFRMINYATDDEDRFVKYIHSENAKTLNANQTKDLLGDLYPNIEVLA